MEINYLPLFVILVIASVVPMVMSWMAISKLPAIVVEIAAGVVVGPFVLDWVSSEEPYLIFLSYTGFLFLIFLSGLALDIQKILNSFPSRNILKIKILKNTFTVSLLIYLLSLGLSVLLVYTMPFFQDMNRLFIAIMLPSVALSVVVPIITSDAEIKTKFGQILLLEGAIATIATILLVAVYAGVYKRGGFELELLLFLVIFLAFFIVYRIGKVLLKVTLFQRLLYQLEHASSQIKIRGAIAVLLLFVMIAKEIHTEPVLGAFFAGVLLSAFLPKERSAPLFKLEGMGYGFFVPIFFITVGVQLDLAAFTEFSSSLTFILILITSFYFIQVVPTVVLMKLFGVRKALSSGMLLTSRLGLTIATSQIGVSLGLLSTAANAAIVTASVITCILSPALYRYMNSKKEHYWDIYIIGANKIASALASRMDMHGISNLMITSDKTEHNRLRAIGMNVLNADEEREETYRELVHIKTPDNVVILMDSKEQNARIANLLSSMGHSKIFTIMDEPYTQLSPLALASGARVTETHEIVASYLENEIMRPSTTHALMDSFGAYSVEEVIVGNNETADKLVKDIPFPQSGSLVLLRRNNEIFIPHGDTRIAIGDVLTVIGNTSALGKFRSLLL